MYFKISLSTLLALASISVGIIRAVPSTKVSIFLHDDGNSECENEGDLLPNPDDCGSFFHCIHGVAYLKDCPSILHFNPVLKVCDWPESAGCETTPPTKNDDAFTCPQPDGSFANPDDCHSFYECVSNVYSLETCPEGFAFDGNDGVCVPTQFAQCSSVRELK